MRHNNTVLWQQESEPEGQRRTDALMAQKIDVAIIFQEMLGTFTHIVIHKSAGVPRATVKVVNFQGLT